MPITLATLETATAQEVFNQVATHLLTQNEISQVYIEGHPRCLYRHTKEDGTLLKCAAGCLMSDEESTKFSASDSWPLLVSKGKVALAHSPLIFTLQNIHDVCAPKDWMYELSKVALDNNFTTEVLSA